MADIDIAEQTPLKQFTATAGQTVFSTDFVVYDEDDIEMYQRGSSQAANDSSDKLLLGIDYTVAGVGLDTGAVVTLLTGATVGDIVTAVRNAALSRTSKYTTLGKFASATVDTDFDEDIIYLQDRRRDTRLRAPYYYYSASIASKDLILPQLGASQFWQMNSLNTGLIAADMEESDGWSTLRSELLSATELAPGSLIVGHYSATNGATTVSAELAYLLANIDPLPVNDTESIVQDPADNTKQMRIDVGAVSASTVRVLSMPDQDFNLTPATSAQIIAGTNNDQPVTSKSLADGSVIILQRVSSQFPSIGTGTTIIPLDNTIPQITEGDQYMTQAITPVSASSKLKIDVILHCSMATASAVISVALFRDATADALIATSQFGDIDQPQTISFSHIIDSSAAISTTLRVRAGKSAGGGTLTINGNAGAQLFNNVSASSITITEYI